VVWAPERTQVRAAEDGFVTRVIARPGQKVKRGDPLIECADPEATARLARTAAELAELEARADAASVSNLVESSILQDQIVHLRAAYEIAAKRIDDLTLKAPVDGVFVIQSPNDLPGRFLQRGDMVADVLDAAGTVRVVVQQDGAERVRSGTQRVQVRPVERVGDVMTARIVREVPAATDELPSMTLSIQGGVKIGLDPTHPGDNRSIDKLFIIDLELPPGSLSNRLGSRVFVRFEHERESLAMQGWRVLRRLFLRKFNV
jgi:putative peptide zinc metalloprotease protein